MLKQIGRIILQWEALKQVATTYKKWINKRSS